MSSKWDAAREDFFMKRNGDRKKRIAKASKKCRVLSYVIGGSIDALDTQTATADRGEREEKKSNK